MQLDWKQAVAYMWPVLELTVGANKHTGEAVRVKHMTTVVLFAPACTGISEYVESTNNGPLGQLTLLYVQSHF